MTRRYRLRGKSFEFSPEGGPIDNRHDYPELFAALGFTSAAWARMECLVTSLVIHINKEEASKALYDPDPANAFKRKSKLLEIWITKHPPHDHLRTQDDTLFFRHLRDLADHRNRLAHGYIETYDPTTKIATVKSVGRQGKDVWKTAIHEIDLDTINNVGMLANTANGYFMSIADEVFGRDDGAPLQTP